MSVRYPRGLDLQAVLWLLDLQDKHMSLQADLSDKSING